MKSIELPVMSYTSELIQELKFVLYHQVGTALGIKMSHKICI